MIVYSLSDQNQRLNVAFTESITIKVQGKEFKLTKFKQQGNNGATYSDGRNVFAKTPFVEGGLTQEATLNGKVELHTITILYTRLTRDLFPRSVYSLRAGVTRIAMTSKPSGLLQRRRLERGSRTRRRSKIPKESPRSAISLSLPPLTSQSLQPKPSMQRRGSTTTT